MVRRVLYQESSDSEPDSDDEEDMDTEEVSHDIPPADEGGGETEVKRTRPDRQKRKAERLECQEHTVQGSLPGRLAVDEDFWTPEQHTALLDLVRQQGRNVSEMKVRASLLAREVIITCLRYPEQYRLPKLDQSFFNRCLIFDGSNEPIINDVITNEFFDYPNIPRMTSDREALSYAAQEMVTVFKNNIKLPFLGRIKDYISTWMRLNGISTADVPVYDVLASIMKWPENKKTRAVFPDVVKTFIASEQQHLRKRTGEEVLASKLRNYYRILEYYRETGAGKGFPLVPAYSIKSHFIGLTTQSLCGLLRDLPSNVRPDWIPDCSIANMVQHHGEMVWRRTLTLDGLVRGREFNRYIQTDGHTIIVHFVAKKKDIEERQRRAKKHKKDGTGPSRVIGIDPGRVNMVAAVEMVDGRVVRHATLTRGVHYQGLKGSIARRTRWDVPLLGVFSRLAKGSVRTTCPVKSFEYRRAILDNYSRLWDNKTSFKRGRDRLFAYSVKRRGMDKFFSDLRGDRTMPAPRVMYGAASIRPNGKGETLTVPVKGVLAACRRFFEVEMVNEYLTTKTHARCGGRMNPVKRRGESYAVRGVCWCPTCKQFVNRDRNAAENMCSLSAEGPRPSHLKFGQAKVVMATLPLLARKKEKRIEYNTNPRRVYRFAKGTVARRTLLVGQRSQILGPIREELV